MIGALAIGASVPLLPTGTVEVPAYAGAPGEPLRYLVRETRSLRRTVRVLTAEESRELEELDATFWKERAA